MTELVSAQDLFKGRHFDQEIIVLCVRWYLTFKLSSRDLIQMMAERGNQLNPHIRLRRQSCVAHLPGGSVVRFEYDEDDRVVSVADWSGGRYTYRYFSEDR